MRNETVNLDAGYRKEQKTMGDVSERIQEQKERSTSSHVTITCAEDCKLHATVSITADIGASDGSSSLQRPGTCWVITTTLSPVVSTGQENSQY
jgi:hypothetical protein